MSQDRRGRGVNRNWVLNSSVRIGLVSKILRSILHYFSTIALSGFQEFHRRLQHNDLLLHSFSGRQECDAHLASCRRPLSCRHLKLSCCIPALIFEQFRSWRRESIGRMPPIRRHISHGVAGVALTFKMYTKREVDSRSLNHDVIGPTGIFDDGHFHGFCVVCLLFPSKYIT